MNARFVFTCCVNRGGNNSALKQCHWFCNIIQNHMKNVIHEDLDGKTFPLLVIINKFSVVFDSEVSHKRVDGSREETREICYCNT